MITPATSKNFADLPMVFTIACGRSGTTLLQTMLDAHPNTIAPLESRFVIHFKNRYGNCLKWTPKVKEKFIKDVLAEQKIAYFWNVDKEALINRINAVPENSTYGLICKQVYASYQSFFTKETPKVIIDKNPIYHLLLSEVIEVYPNARFICLVRDYRAVVSSFKQLRPKDLVKVDGYRWLLANQEIDELKNKFPEKFISLRYEDLLQKPNLEMEKLTKFLNLEFHPATLNYHQEVSKSFNDYIEASPSKIIKKFRLESSRSVHKNLSKPIDSSFINKWKEKLSKNEIGLLEKICGKYGNKHCYKTSTSPKTIPQIPKKIYFSLKQKIQWYYRLPIWFRELKSKPRIGLVQIKK